MDDFQYHAIMRELEGIAARLDRQNGRLGEAEVEIGVLMDRSNRAERQGGIWGAVSGGVVSGVVIAVKALLGK